MAELKLTYFDFSASRGEECRLALHVAGADFEDNRVPRAQWPELKPTTPFGGMPILETEGKPALGQCNAILTYIAQRYDLQPTDPWDAARHHAILCAVEDLRAEMAPLVHVKGDEEKKRTRGEFVDGYLRRWASNIEKQIEGPFLSGAKLCVADIKLFVISHAFISGIYDHVPADVLSAFGRLTALHGAVAAHPKIAEWRAKS